MLVKTLYCKDTAYKKYRKFCIFYKLCPCNTIFFLSLCELVIDENLYHQWLRVWSLKCLSALWEGKKLPVCHWLSLLFTQRFHKSNSERSIQNWIEYSTQSIDNEALWLVNGVASVFEHQINAKANPMIAIINPGSVFTNHSQEHSRSFFPKRCKFECSTSSDWRNHRVPYPAAAILHLSLLIHLRKVVSDFRKKSCVSTVARKLSST